MELKFFDPKNTCKRLGFLLVYTIVPLNRWTNDWALAPIEIDVKKTPGWT